MSKRPKYGHFGLSNGHFGFENGHGSFQKYFHLIGSKKLYYRVWNHQFYNNILYLPVSEMSNGLKMAILGFKIASLDSKMAMDIFENNFI